MGFCVARTRNGPRHVVARAADRHVPLGHDLEQRRLHLGRRAVDLVGEHEVGHDRPELGVEGLGPRSVDPRADDVGRHEVRRELQPGERPVDGAGQRLDGERLGHAGHALEQAVALREQAHHQPLDQPLLADDDALDLEHRPLDRGGVRRRGVHRSGLGHASPPSGPTCWLAIARPGRTSGRRNGITVRDEPVPCLGVRALLGERLPLAGHRGSAVAQPRPARRHAASSTGSRATSTPITWRTSWDGAASC